MLVRFSVNNFLSFKDVATIKMAAGKARVHSDHVKTFGDGQKILKGGIIFGANASGKSNLIKAMDFAKKTILEGSDPGKCYKKYFRINNLYEKKLGTFQFELFTNGHFYSYGFSINYATAEIEEEWLHLLSSSGGEERIFERGRNEYGKMIVEKQNKFNDAEDETIFNVIATDISSDKMRRRTLLHELSNWRNDSKFYGVFRDIIDWFYNFIIIFPNSMYNNIDGLVRYDDSRSVLENYLRFFDTGIKSLALRKKPFDTVFSNLPAEDKAQLRERVVTKLADLADSDLLVTVDYNEVMLKNDELVVEETMFNHGNSEDLFEFRDQSDGTQRLLHLIPVYDATTDNCVIVIDEIDRSLHSKATQEFIRSFYKHAAQFNSQLIATTHDTNILDLDLLRRDEIWLVEKTSDNASVLKPLSHYNPRHDKGHNIGRDYLIGRYGAVPIFDHLALLADEE